MPKEVEEKICVFCESQYKLSYVGEDVSGYPKFCCFCGETWDEGSYDEKDEELE
jgi:hypothetical protein